MIMMILVEYLVLHQDGKTSSVTRCLRTGKQQERYKCATFDILMEICENDEDNACQILYYFLVFVQDNKVM